MLTFYANILTSIITWKKELHYTAMKKFNEIIDIISWRNTGLPQQYGHIE